MHTHAFSRFAGHSASSETPDYDPATTIHFTAARSHYEDMEDSSNSQPTYAVPVDVTQSTARVLSLKQGSGTGRAAERDEDDGDSGFGFVGET